MTSSKPPLESSTHHCDQHGTYEVSAFMLRAAKSGRFAPTCPKCHDARRANEAATEQVVRLERQAKARHLEMIETSRLRGRFLQATFENYETSNAEQHEVLQACRRFAEDFEAGQGGAMWLLGGVGVGKTHLCAAIVNLLITEKQVQGVLITARGIIQALRERWGQPDSGAHERGVIEALSSVPLLIVDEVCQGVTSERDRDQLYDVLDLRYQEMRPTVIAGNARIADVQKQLGPRLYDRLRERAQVLTLTWDSNRGRM